MAARLRLSREDRDRRLLESFKAGDVARQNPRHPGEWLVSSKTHSSDTATNVAKVSYRVQLGDERRPGTCGCKGFQYRGMCRHIVRASYEQHQLNLKARREQSHDLPAKTGDSEFNAGVQVEQSREGVVSNDMAHSAMSSRHALVA